MADYAIGYPGKGGYEWHFVLREDDNAVSFEDVVGVQGECPALGLPQHSSNGLITFKFPECVVIRESLELSTRDGWIVIEPYGTAEYSVSWWYRDKGSIFRCSHYTIGPTIRAGWRFTPMPYRFSPLDDVSDVNRQFLAENLNRSAIADVSFSFIGLFYAILAFAIIFEVLRFLDSKTWSRLVSGASYLPLALLFAYLVYGYVQSKREFGASDHPLNELEGNAWITFAGVMTWLAMRYIVNYHYDAAADRAGDRLWKAEPTELAKRQKWEREAYRRRKKFRARSSDPRSAPVGPYQEAEFPWELN